MLVHTVAHVFIYTNFIQGSVCLCVCVCAVHYFKYIRECVSVRDIQYKSKHTTRRHTHTNTDFGPFTFICESVREFEVGA
jgi:hypothetical protein